MSAADKLRYVSFGGLALAILAFAAWATQLGHSDDWNIDMMRIRVLVVAIPSGIGLSVIAAVASTVVKSADRESRLRALGPILAAVALAAFVAFVLRHLAIA